MARTVLLARIAEATGWVAEVRREGIALLDESGQSADVRLAEEGTDGHLTLLLAQFLAEAARGAGEIVIGHAAVRARTVQLIAEHRKHWRRDAAEPGRAAELTETALRRLEALRLIAREEEGVRPRPAIARFAVGDPILDSDLFLTENRVAHSQPKLEAAHGKALDRQKQHEANRRQARRLLDGVTQAMTRLADEAVRNAAEQAALRESPEMRSANQLHAARKEAETAELALRSAEAESRTAAEGAARAEKDSTGQREQSHAATGGVERQAADASTGATDAGLADEHLHATEALHAATIPEPAAIQAAEQTLKRTVTRRLDSARHLENLERILVKADGSLEDALRNRGSAETQHDAAVAEHQQTDRAVEEAAGGLLAAYGAWTQGVTELKPMAADAFEAKFEGWLETGGGASAAADAVGEARRQAEGLLADARAEARQRRANLETVLRELEAEHARLADGVHLPPPAPPTREPLGRAGRAGAPFYTLFDFRPELSPADRAGLEAALEGAGLLDAWVTPEGHLLADDEVDTVLVTGLVPPAPPARTLAEALAPEKTPPVEPATLRALLGAVGFGEGAGGHWVSRDGSWQLGPLRGRWRKPSAQHLGASAREADRREQMAGVKARETLCLADLGAATADLAAVADRGRTIAREAAAAPSDAAIIQAIAERKSASANCAAASMRRRNPCATAAPNTPPPNKSWTTTRATCL